MRGHRGSTHRQTLRCASRRYLVLCPAYSTAEGAGSDYATLRATVAGDARLQDVPDHSDLLQVFITDEIAGVEALTARYSGEMTQQSSIFGGEAGAARRDDFRRRVGEHNVLVVARYYSRLRLPRLATLLAVPEADAEAQLSDLAVKGAVTAKIDRPAGLVRFEMAHDSSQVCAGCSPCACVCCARLRVPHVALGCNA